VHSTADPSGAAGQPLVVLSGPSGVGKSTVVKALRRHHPGVWVSVSVTTRPPRRHERDGVDYHFVSQAEFARMADAGELLEWAVFAGNSYGTPRAAVLERVAAGQPVLMEIDLQGARIVRDALPEAYQVFLAPPSWEELERRLTRRGSESAAAVAARLAQARAELAAMAEFDRVLVNHDVETVCRELLALMGREPEVASEV
jgi:guanylate kinase